MSRTDKDAPYWVRTEWYEPDHYCGWRRWPKYEVVEKEGPWGTYKTYRTIGHRWEYLGDCDLPEVPIRQNRRVGRKTKLLNKTSQRCMWWAKWPEDHYVQTRGIRKKFARHVEYWGPNRAAVRDAARDVIKGNHEKEFPDGRTRHSLLWDLA